MAAMILVVGCSGQELTKKDYYEKGLEFMRSGNANGAIIAFKKAIEKDQNFFEARYQLALAYIKQDKYESAERELMKVLRLNPTFDEARLQLAKAYVSLDKNDEAIEMIGDFLDSDKNNAEAIELLASAYASKKEYAEAERSLNSVLKMSPERNSAKVALARVYLQSERTDDAEKILRDVLKSDDGNRDALYLYAEIKSRQKNLKEVIAAYEKILALNPHEMNAELGLGYAHLMNGSIDESRTIAQNLIKSYENRPEGFYLMGLVHFHEKELDQAIALLNKALSLGDSPQANYYLGLCLLSKGSLEQAAGEFQRVVDRAPEMVQARILLSLTHLKTGRTDNAEREVLEVLRQDENNAFAHNVLGSVYLAQGKGEESIREFDRAIELDPSLADAHMKKGISNLLAGDSAEAEADFINAVEHAPDILNTRIMLARYYIREKRFDDAIKTLNEGLKDNKDDALLYNVMGVAYAGSANNTAAEQNFKKAVAADAGFILSYFNLADVYRKDGRLQDALAQYKRVLSIDENNLRALLMIAEIMEKDKRYEDALSYYGKAAAQKQPEASIALAGYYQRRQDGKKAIEVLEDALRVNPRNMQVLDAMGRVYFANKEYEKTISVYQRMSSISPAEGKRKMAAAYSAMGRQDEALRALNGLDTAGTEGIRVKMQRVNILMKKKDYAAAEKNAKEIIAQAPESEAGYLILAQVYMETHDYSKAISVLSEAEKMNPGNVQVKITKGNAYVQMKDYTRAMDIFDGLQKKYPNLAPPYFFQGSALEMMGKTEAAVKRHEKALEISPDYAPSLNNLAYLYAEGQGNIEKAVELARRAKKIVPGDGNITDTLGWTLFKKGNYDEALEYFLEALSYLPEEPTIRYHLGLAYHKKGMEAPAREQLEKAILLGKKSHFHEIDEARDVLEGLKGK